MRAGPEPDDLRVVTRRDVFLRWIGKKKQDLVLKVARAWSFDRVLSGLGDGELDRAPIGLRPDASRQRTNDGIALPELTSGFR